MPKTVFKGLRNEQEEREHEERLELIRHSLKAYAAWAKIFWNKIIAGDVVVPRSGLFRIESDKLPGVAVKVSGKPNQSLVKGLQIVPFVETKYIPYLKGKLGIKGTLEDLCNYTDSFIIDGIRFLVKHHLAGTSTSAQFLCMINEELYQQVTLQRKAMEFQYVAIRARDLLSLRKGIVPDEVRRRCDLLCHDIVDNRLKFLGEKDIEQE